MAFFGPVIGWFLLLALVGTLGPVLARWLLLPRLTTLALADRRWALDQTDRLGAAFSLLLIPALALFFVRQFAEFRDPFAPVVDDLRILLGGDWGAVWLSGVATATVATVAVLRTNAVHRGGAIVSLVALLILSAFPAFTGHAAGATDLRSLAILSDTIHVVAASGWMGGLGVVLFLELRWRRRSDGGSLLSRLVPAFSPLAVACVVALSLTGVFAGWLHMEAFSDLWTTRYGRVLLTKLGLVALVLALGALNWRRLTPRLSEPGGPEAMRKAATIELMIGHAVLFVTAVLVRTSPMDH